MNYAEIQEEASDARLAIEKANLEAALERNKWSVTAAASDLGVATSTLYRAIERHPELQQRLRAKSPPPGRVPVRK